MKYALWALALILVAGAAYAMADYVIPHTWRYKITIEIETPEGVKSGSAVREVRAWKNAAKWLNPDIRDLTFEVIGEAVVVDLGERGQVFALIDWNSYKEVETAFPTRHSDSLEYLRYYSSLKLGLKNRLEINQPKMVTFKSIDDPKTVEFVYENTLYANGHEKVDNFGKIFGGGIKLGSVTVEIVDESVTEKIDSILPSFGPNKGFAEWKMSLGYGNPLDIDRSNFKKGD